MRKALRDKVAKAKKKASEKVKSNRIYLGDNLEIMRSLEGGKIDLIYIDPPFCAQNVFKSKAWGKKTVEFNDEWGGGINSYIRWLVPRLWECHRLLKDTGVLCLHLDQRSSHYAQVELDKIFGEKNLVNEIIWCYAGGGQSKKRFPKKHDIILVYSKTKRWKFNADDIRVPYDSKYSGTSFKSNGTRAQGKTYRPNPLGKIPEDYWRINRPYSDEVLGYPTQKPLALLERLIKAFTSKNDLVADFFCGCGTTVSAAQNLGRKWLGSDISPDAIFVIEDRMLKEHRLGIETIDTKQPTREEIYNLGHFEFEKKMVEMLGGTPNAVQVGDGGVDGRMYDSTPIQVKMSENVGRPVVDLFYKHVKSGNGKGIIIAKSFSKTAYEEVARLANTEGLQIDLVPSNDIIRDSGTTTNTTKNKVKKSLGKLKKALPKRKDKRRTKRAS